MYKRIAGIETDAQLEDVRGELTDRYGELPAAVRHLLDYASLKLQAARVGAINVERKRDLANIKFKQSATIDPGKLAQFVASQRGAKFTPDGTLKFTLTATAPEQVMNSIRAVLEQLTSAEVASEA
jgi:transcription-repair coupling factor (superfamily II helicase)